MKKWEYKIFIYDSDVTYSTMLDRIGSQGWELVAVEATNAGSKLFFKRPVGWGTETNLEKEVD